MSLEVNSQVSTSDISAARVPARSCFESQGREILEALLSTDKDPLEHETVLELLDENDTNQEIVLHFVACEALKKTLSELNNRESMTTLWEKALTLFTWDKLDVKEGNRSKALMKAVESQGLIDERKLHKLLQILSETDSEFINRRHLALKVYLAAGRAMRSEPGQEEKSKVEKEALVLINALSCFSEQEVAKLLRNEFLEENLKVLLEYAGRLCAKHCRSNLEEIKSQFCRLISYVTFTPQGVNQLKEVFETSCSENQT